MGEGLLPSLLAWAASQEHLVCHCMIQDAALTLV